VRSVETMLRHGVALGVSKGYGEGCGFATKLSTMAKLG
jgi:hypothetical protein